MSYTNNGQQITVNFPVDSISVNKSSIVFTDSLGKNRQTFSNRTEALHFINWLLTTNS